MVLFWYNKNILYLCITKKEIITTTKKQNKMKTIILATVARETEKALQINAVYNHMNSGSERVWTAWVPKSHAKVVRDNAVELSSWLANKIDKEICEFQRCFAMPNQLNVLIQNG